MGTPGPATSPTPPTTAPCSTPSPGLGEATGEARWIDEARSVADALLDLFWDDERGGVFTTGRDAEPLVTRPKDLLDNATPVGQQPGRARPVAARRA